MQYFGVYFTMLQVITLFFSVFFLSSFFINPNLTQTFVTDGASLFFHSVFPSLFTFCFIVNLLKFFNVDRLITKILYKPLNKFFGLGRSCCYPVFVGLTSGYPMNAKAMTNIYSQGVLPTENLLVTFALSSISNPLFIVVTVGGTMLNSINLGIILLITQYLTAVINGKIWSKIPIKSTNAVYLKTYEKTRESLLDVMKNTLSSCLVVFGFICLFNFIIEVLLSYKIIDFLAKVLSSVFTLINVPKNLATPLIISFFEITRGLQLLSFTSENLVLTLTFASSILYFGGISIFLQSLSFMSNCNVKIKYLLLVKITGAIIAPIICFLLCIIFNI